jgi:hypothetical protein
VTAGLEAAGIARCNGDVMATNAALRLPLQDWVRRFDFWMSEQSPKASEQLSIIFDFRRVAGKLEAEGALDDIMATAVNRPIFLAHLARRALDLRPPIGFVRGLIVDHRGEHPGTVDLKHGGILIVGNIARAWATRTGVTAKRTLHRLRAARCRGRCETARRRRAFRFCGGSAATPRRADAASKADDFVDPKASAGMPARSGRAFRRMRGRRRSLPSRRIERTSPRHLGGPSRRRVPSPAW